MQKIGAKSTQEKLSSEIDFFTQLKEAIDTPDLESIDCLSDTDDALSTISSISNTSTFFRSTSPTSSTKLNKHGILWGVFKNHETNAYEVSCVINSKFQFLGDYISETRAALMHDLILEYFCPELANNLVCLNLYGNTSAETEEVRVKACKQANLDYENVKTHAAYLIHAIILHGTAEKAVIRLQDQPKVMQNFQASLKNGTKQVAPELTFVYSNPRRSMRLIAKPQEKVSSNNSKCMPKPY